MPENNTDNSSPAIRFRTGKEPAVSGDDNNAGASGNVSAPGKKKVINPLPDNQKDKVEMVGDAHASGHVSPTPANTTTIPGGVSTGAGRPAEHVSLESEQPQIPANETSKLSSILPTQEHLDSIENPDLPASGDSKESNRTAVIVLGFLLLAALLLSAGWLFLSS